MSRFALTSRVGASTIGGLLMLSLSGCKVAGVNEAFGAVGSAAACAAFSTLTGGDSKQTAAAAIICGIVGFAVTKELEDRRKQFASDEQFYAAELKRLNAYEQQLAADVDSANRALVADKARVATLVRAAESSAAERTELESLAGNLKARQTSLSDELETAEENRKYQKGLLARMKETEGETTPEAERQLAALESSIEELRGLVGEHEVQTASLGVYL